MAIAADRISELELENARLRARMEELTHQSLGSSLRAIASQIPDNLIVIDREYRIKFINWTVPDSSHAQRLRRGGGPWSSNNSS